MPARAFGKSDPNGRKRVLDNDRGSQLRSRFGRLSTLSTKITLVHLPPQRCFIASEPLKGFAVELKEPSSDCRIEGIILGYIITVFQRCMILETANLSDAISSSLLQHALVDHNGSLPPFASI
jgi:hypothetical protein